ncbi:MAG: AEC family transporter [Suipraeoptans sp.]
MGGIYLGIRVVSPLIVYMAIGIVAKKIKILSTKTFDEMNKLTFRVFLALLVFVNSYQADLNAFFSADSLKVILIAMASIFILLSVSLIIGRQIIIDKERHIVITQGIYRSNLILFGLPISISIYGEGNQATMSVLIAVIVPLFNIIAAILLNSAKGGSRNKLTLILSALKNPLVIGSILGLAINAIGITLPEIVFTPIDKLAGIATPLAFILLGGSLEFSNIKKDLKAITCVSVIRLIILPLAVITFATLSGLKDTNIVALLALSGSPIAVSSYTMAKDAEVAPALAGELVAVTTVVSTFTIFLWVASLSSLGLL